MPLVRVRGDRSPRLSGCLRGHFPHQIQPSPRIRLPPVSWNTQDCPGTIPVSDETVPPPPRSARGCEASPRGTGGSNGRGPECSERRIGQVSIAQPSDLAKKHDSRRKRIAGNHQRSGDEVEPDHLKRLFRPVARSKIDRSLDAAAWWPADSGNAISSSDSTETAPVLKASAVALAFGCERICQFAGHVRSVA